MIHRRFSILFLPFLILAGCSKKNYYDSKDYDVQIVLGSKAPNSVELAAYELVDHLERITNEKYLITSRVFENIAKTIFVGDSEALRNRVTLKTDLNHDEFVIKGDQDYLALYGNDTVFRPRFDYAKSYEDIPRANEIWQRQSGTKTRSPIHGLYKAYNREFELWEYDSKGTLFAVYEYLRSLGVEWYMLGKEGVILPDKAQLSWENIEKVVRPDFKLRWNYRYAQAFVQSGEEELLWYLRLGLNRDAKFLGIGEPGHGISNVVADPIIRKRYPEYFALYNGKRNNPEKGTAQVCLSSKGLKELNIKYVRAVFDIYDVDALSVMPPDGFSHICQCSLCEDKDTPNRGREGKLSDYVWNYVNDVAKEVYKTHPDKVVTCFAYGYSLLPPLKIDKLSPNIRVGICRSRASFTDLERINQFDEIQSAWNMLSSKALFTYDYYLYARPLRQNYNLPVFIPEIIKSDLTSLKKQYGVAGEFIEVLTDYDGKQGDIIEIINHINVYLTSRLYWDVHQDVNLLLDSYFKSMYPASSNEVKQFYNYVALNWHLIKRDSKKYYKALNLLNTAIDKAGGQAQVSRLKELKKYISPLRVGKVLQDLANDEQREIRVIKLKGLIKVDGKLDDSGWKSPFDFRMANPKSISRSLDNSRVQFTWDQNNFYIGARLKESDIKSLNTRSKRAINVRARDHVIFKLMTLDRSELQILIDTNGNLDVLKKPNKYEKEIKASVSINESDWSIELSIPIIDGELFANDFGINGHIPTDQYPWFFNIIRVRHHNLKKDVVNFANYTNGKMVKDPLSKIYFRGY